MSAGGSYDDWFYLHDDDESQLSSQNMPELHSVGVRLLVVRRVAVITVPTNKEHQSCNLFHFVLEVQLQFHKIIYKNKETKNYCMSPKPPSLVTY